MCCSLLYIYSLLVSGFTVNKTSAILFVVLGAVMVVALLVELMIINIYRRKLHENQKKTRQLDSVQKQLQMEFVANMTHEVRTPMNAILGFTTILAEMDDLDQETRHQLIMEVEKNKEVLLKILNDILDYSQLSSNSLQFQEEKVSVNAVLADCLALALAKCRNSSVTLVIADKLPYCSLKIDKRRFSQVLNNLIRNAITYTEKGQITLGYRRLPDNTLYFFVSDTGCGIDILQHRRIFNSFAKVDSNIRGAGLGLTHSKAIVEHYGGHMGVESKLGLGSTFYFTLPSRLEVKEYGYN